MRCVAVMMVGILTAIAAQAQFTLDLQRPVLDSLTQTWLCPISRAAFGTDARMRFDFADTTAVWTNVVIDNQPVKRGDTVNFTAIAGNRSYPITATDTAGNTISGNICFTYHPVLELIGEFGYNYVNGTVIANQAGQAPTEMFAKLKWRGASTNSELRHKRNYHIKFLNPADSSKVDRTFFGLRQDNSWILDAGQVDMSRLRNRIATELWLDINSRPYYGDLEPDALNGVRGDVVEIVLNGKYAGIYCLTEAMDRKQLKLKKYKEDTGTFRGMLWKATVDDAYTRMTNSAIYPLTANSETWGGYEVKYPDPDDVMPTDWSTLHQAQEFVVKSTGPEFDAHIGEYYDIPVLVDYWVMINTLLGVDSGIKNIYWACYDQTKDKKITLAAWDLDCTVGQYWVNYPFRDQSKIGPTRRFSSFNQLFHRLFDRNSCDFDTRAVERYWELRKTLLHPDSLIERYTTRIRDIIDSGAADRESARWSGDRDISYNRLDFEDEINYISNWIRTRIPYLDNGMFRPYVYGDINRDGSVDIADINALIAAIFRQNDYPLWYEDLCKDDRYDIADLNILINIILNNNPSNR